MEDYGTNTDFGNEQSNHFKQLKAVLKEMGYDWSASATLATKAKRASNWSSSTKILECA